MKTLLRTFLILWAPVVFAQGFGSMDPAQMQQMMEKMVEVQACFEQVDQSQMEQMLEEAQAMEAEVKQMCEAGQRAKAQATAMKFGMEYSARPEIAQLKACAEIAKDAMPAGLMPQVSDFAYTDTNSYESSHLCDQI